LICCYHKGGSTLFSRVMSVVGHVLGLRTDVIYGKIWGLDSRLDIACLLHSLIGFELARPFRAVRVVRDPRDLWLSAYLYHCHCDEGWCVNDDFNPSPPIGYPRVDFSFRHKTERWKRRYLVALGGRSYQQNLLQRDREAGLQFELDHYTACTMDAMRAWRLSGPGVMTVRLEDVGQNYDASMLAVLRHLGFSEAECAAVLPHVRAAGVTGSADAVCAATTQVAPRTVSKWQSGLSPHQVALFERRHGDLIQALGYTLSMTRAAADEPGREVMQAMASQTRG
jgi:hypothetical protein